MNKNQLKAIGLGLSAASMLITIAASFVSDKQLDMKIDEKVREILENLDKQ